MKMRCPYCGGSELSNAGKQLAHDTYGIKCITRFRKCTRCGRGVQTAEISLDWLESLIETTALYHSQRELDSIMRNVFEEVTLEDTHVEPETKKTTIKLNLRQKHTTTEEDRVAQLINEGAMQPVDFNKVAASLTEFASATNTPINFSDIRVLTEEEE